MKSLLKNKGLLSFGLLSLAIVSTPASAKYKHSNTHIDYAKVTHVEPIFETLVHSVPKEQCWNERVRSRKDYRPESTTPVLLGALIGGAIGNELGHRKRNKQVGAVVGGLLGGSIGQDIARDSRRHHNHQHTNHYETIERCEVSYDRHEEQSVVGYDVTYLYHGNKYTTQTDRHPGKKVKVQISVLAVE